jgi:hypothetical protein
MELGASLTTRRASQSHFGASLRGFPASLSDSFASLNRPLAPPKPVSRPIRRLFASQDGLAAAQEGSWSLRQRVRSLPHEMEEEAMESGAPWDRNQGTSRGWPGRRGAGRRGAGGSFGVSSRHGVGESSVPRLGYQGWNTKVGTQRLGRYRRCGSRTLLAGVADSIQVGPAQRPGCGSGLGSSR